MYYFYNLFFDIMKKLHVILLLILVLALWILWWIYIGKSSKTNWISKQKIFENDLKCQEKLDAYRDDLKSRWYTDIFVFYSPIENSCLWTFKTYNLYDNNVIYNSYSYNIEDLSNSQKYATFGIDNYYSWNDVIGLKIVIDKFTGKDCEDIDYRAYERSEEDKEYYKNTSRCKFDNIEEAYQKELEYLKWN